MGHGVVEDRCQTIRFVSAMDKVTIKLENVMFLIRGKGAQRFEPVDHAFKHAAEDTWRVRRMGRDVGMEVQWLFVEGSMNCVGIGNRNSEI